MSESPNRLSGSARRRARLGESGFSLLELMVAMTVLTVGMLGAMIMIVAGMQSNTRNKNDSTAVVLDQEILEMFATLKLYPAPQSVTVSDCAPNVSNATHNASRAQGPSPTGAGATLNNVGDIDWTQPTPALATSAAQGYAMLYRTCSGDVYEVRWNIMQNPAPNGTTHLSMLTVSSRQRAAQGSPIGMLFAPSTTLHTLIESN